MRVLWALAVLGIGLVAAVPARAEWSFQYRSGPASPYDRLYQYARPYPPGHARRHHRHHHHHYRQHGPLPMACWSEWMRVRGGYVETRHCAPVQALPPTGFHFRID